MDVVDSPDVRPQLPPPPDFRPTFSSRTRDLFRQKMRRRSSQLQQQLGEHLDKLPAHPQRPTKLPLMVLSPTASTAGLKCTTTQERKSPQKPPPLLNPTTSWQQARKVAMLSSRVPSSKSTSDMIEASPPVTPASQMEFAEHTTIDATDDLDCSEVIFLPQSEPIPQQFWSMAQGWIPVVGRDIVACLFSRDWQLRESSIRRLSHEVANALLTFDPSNMERLDRIWRCTAEMIAKAAEDKVYKVYSAAIKALKSLLAFTHFAPDLNYVQAGIRPIIYSILLKCADGQKRMAELSMETIHDLCRNFLVGSGATGQKQRSTTTMSTMTLQGLDLIFQMIVEDKDPSWQFTMGRLVALEHLLTLMKVESAQAGIALDFSLHNLSNGHSRVAKMALKVFVLSAKLLTSSEPSDFEQVWKLILTLPDPTLQLTLRKKLKIALRSLPSPNYEMVNKIIDGHLDLQSPCSNTSVMALMSPPIPLIRSTSSSPSRPAGTSKKSNKRHTPYGRRPAKNTTANCHFPPPFKRTVSLKDDEVVKILPATSSYPCWTSSCHFDRPLPLVPSLSFHKSWHTTEDVKDSLLYSEGKQWSKSFMLGSGAFSTCFQARDVETGTLMAVKQIQLNRTGLQNEEEKVKWKILLQQEIDLMSMLDHPNLIRFYGVVEEAAQLNIFVEWMPGGSVAKLLDKHGAFTENVILKYTQQILQGLSYLHSMGIIHRDLKGANLFVDNTGHHLRIGDFGAAACLYSKVTVPGEFRGQLQGTLAFMAPEVLRGESYGRSCDIWSLGCCIIEMATAKAPWNASDISNYYCLMYKIACSSDPPSLPSHLSRGLHNMASKCLQLSPENRPQAQQLLCHSLFAISDV